MKNVFSAITLTLVALFVGFYFGTHYNHQSKEEISVQCGYDKEMIIEAYNNWINEDLKKINEMAVKYPVKVEDVIGIMEYKTIPVVMKNPLYDDFKNSKICKATLLVNYASKGEKGAIEEIDIRFQKTATSPNEQGEFRKNISSSGYDVENMKEQALEFFKKYHEDISLPEKASSFEDNGLIIFPQKGKCFHTNQIRVFQAIRPGKALAMIGKLSDPTIVLLLDENEKPYYDDEIIDLPKDKCAKQIGTYQYETAEKIIKTVPAVHIE